MDKTAEPVTLRRTVANGQPIERECRARIVGYAPSELAAGITVGERVVILAADEVAASGFPLPFKKASDRIVVRGTALTVTQVDDSTRRVAGQLIAYELRASGA